MHKSAAQILDEALVKQQHDLADLLRRTRNIQNKQSEWKSLFKDILSTIDSIDKLAVDTKKALDKATNTHDQAKVEKYSHALKSMHDVKSEFQTSFELLCISALRELDILITLNKTKNPSVITHEDVAKIENALMLAEIISVEMTKQLSKAIAGKKILPQTITEKVNKFMEYSKSVKSLARDLKSSPTLFGANPIKVDCVSLAEIQKILHELNDQPKQQA